MSGAFLKEISANVFAGGTYSGDIDATTITSTSTRMDRVEYVSSGTEKITSVSTADSQVGDVSITWPGFNPTGGQVLSAADASGQLTWATALSSADPLLTVAQRVRVKQNPGVGEFLFIASAIASITDASSSKPYFVEVGPGVYTEGNITVPAFVSVQGMDQKSTIVVPTAGVHTFLLTANSDLRKLTIQGSTSTGFAAVAATATGSCSLKDVYVQGADIGLLLDATGSNAIKCNAEHLILAQTVTNGVLVRSVGSAVAELVIEGFGFNNTATATSETVLESNGANSVLTVVGGTMSLNLGEAAYGTGMLVQNGGELKLLGGKVASFVTGLSVPSDAGTPTVVLSAVDFSNTTTHVNVANANTLGYVNGDISDLSTLSINQSAPFRVSNMDNLSVHVAVKGGDFSTVEDALAFVASQTPTAVTPWKVFIGAGTYTVANPVTVPQFVYIQGASSSSTILIAGDNDENLFNFGGNDVVVTDMSTVGPNNAAAFFFDGEPLGPYFFRYTFLTNLDISAARYGIDFINTNGIVNASLTSISVGGIGADMNGAFSRVLIRLTQDNADATKPIALKIVDLQVGVSSGQEATGVPPYDSFTVLEHNGFTGAPQTLIGIISGVVIQFAPAVGTVAKAFDLENVDFEVDGLIIRNFHEGVEFRASTLPCSTAIGSINATGNTTDIIIANNNVSGVIRATNSQVSKVDDSSATDHDVSFLIQGPLTEGTTFTGPVNMGESFDTITSMLQSFQHSGTTTGILLGGAFSLTGGLGIQVAAGSGYVTGTDEGNPSYVEWSSALTDTMPADVDRFVSVTSAGAIQLTSSAPSTYAAIVIARVKSDATGIVFVERIARQALHTPTLLDTTMRDAFGPIVASGIIGAAGTAAFQIDVGSGKYFYSTHEYSPSGGSDITFTPLFHSSGVFVSGTPVNVLSAANARRYDDGTDLVALGVGNWVKHALYVLNDGADEKYLFIYGQTEFASQSAAENGALPLQPAFVGENLAGVSAFVLGDASTDWVTIQDIRPTLAFTAAGVTATTDHGSLTGLLDDDHTQYLLVDGSRAMVGALNLGSNNITNPGTIDGVTITDMSDRLRPGGADEIPTAAPVTLSALTNSVGSSTSLARADHLHAHGVQTDATLHAAATAGVNGFMPGTDKTKLDASTPASTASTLVERDGAGSINLDGLVLDANGAVQFANSGDTFHVTLQAPAGLAADYTLTLPPNDGDNLQVLQTDGAGVTSWVTAAGGFADPMTTAGDMIIRNAGNTTDRLAAGAETNQVLTTGSTGVPTWQTAGAVVDPTVSKTLTFFDECVAPPQLLWRFNDSAKVLPYNLGSGDALGISQLDTVSGSNPAATAVISSNASLRGGLGSVSVKMRVLFQNLSGGGQKSEVSFGLGDTTVDNSASLGISNGAFFYLQNNADIQIRTAAGASLTSQATSPLQTVVVDTWYVAEMVVTANGAGTWTSIEFLWDGVSVGTITTNLPNAVSQPFASQVYIRKNAGNAGHAMLMDYYYLNYEMVAVR